MIGKEFTITFDSGHTISREGFFDPHGKLIRSFEKERENFKFDDSISDRKFVIEVVFRGGIIVFLYPKDLLKLGYNVPEEKLQAEAKSFKKWLEKIGFMTDAYGEEIEVMFDPRSYMVHAAIQLA